jgi:hypothetical protein
MNTDRFSIRTLNHRMLNPNLRKAQCTFLIHTSRLIRARTNDEENYTDTYYFCTYLKKRIVKKYCINCQCYKPLINKENESIGQANA